MEDFSPGYVPNLELVGFLFREDNVPVLEGILQRLEEEYAPLQEAKRAGKLNLGGPVASKTGLEQLLAPIHAEVERFLGFRGPSDIKVMRSFSKEWEEIYTWARYVFVVDAVASGLLLLVNRFTYPYDYVSMTIACGSLLVGLSSVALLNGIFNPNTASYQPNTHHIILPKGYEEAEIVTTSGHEYAHGVVMRRFKTEFPSAFGEGIARGVENHLSSKLSNATGNTAYRYRYLSNVIRDLRKAYEGLCNEFGIKPRIGLETEGQQVSKPLLLKSEPDKSPHALGSASFSILEQRHGPGIYRKAVCEGLVLA